MRTKSWLIVLPLLCLAGGAIAQPAAPEAPAEAAAVKVQMPAQAEPSARPRQGGDIRYCLDKRDNKAVIRCAEQGRKPVHQARRKAARKH